MPRRPERKRAPIGRSMTCMQTLTTLVWHTGRSFSGLLLFAGKATRSRSLNYAGTTPGPWSTAPVPPRQRDPVRCRCPRRRRNLLPVRFAAAQLLRKPKGQTLRSLLRITDGDTDGRDRTADLMLLDGDCLVLVVRGLGFRRVTAISDEQRRRLFHESHWVKRSLIRKPDEQQHNILVVNCVGAFDHLTNRLAASGTQLRYAASTLDAQALISQDRPTDIFWLWQRTGRATSTESLREECERNYRDLLALLNVLQKTGFGQGQRLWLVTHRAQLLPGDEPSGDGPAFAAATLWGSGRALWNENPSYQATLVDLDSTLDPLLDECQAAEPEEFHVAYRQGKRHVLRIRPTDQAGADDNFELAIPNPGEFAISNVFGSPMAPQKATKSRCTCTLLASTSRMC